MYLVLRAIMSPYAALFMKVDSSFNRIWVKTYDINVFHKQVSMTQDQSSIAFSLTGTSNCQVGKINSSDGVLMLESTIDIGSD